MTKTQKKETISEMMNKLIVSKSENETSSLVESLVTELYSAGYLDRQMPMVKDVIETFVKDLINPQTREEMGSLYIAQSKQNLYSLIDTSLLPD